jgi:hypothetical protein
MVARPILLVIVMFAGVACSHLPRSDLSRVRPEFTDILDPKMRLVGASDVSQADLRHLLVALRKGRSEQKMFDRITKISFQSPTRAKVTFIWSIHFGEFTLEKKSGVWTFVEQFWAI